MIDALPLTDQTNVAPGVELVTVGLMVELPQTDCGQAISQLGAGTTLTVCEQVCPLGPLAVTTKLPVAPGSTVIVEPAFEPTIEPLLLTVQVKLPVPLTLKVTFACPLQTVLGPERVQA